MDRCVDVEKVGAETLDGRFYSVSPEALRRGRRARLLTQEALAEASGVHRGTISQAEMGGGRRVRVGTLQALAEALGVQPEELLARTDSGDGSRRRGGGK